MTRSTDTRSIGEALRDHPLALAALEHNLQRQQSGKAVRAAPSAEERARCPHCGAAGVPHEVHGRTYYRWPTDCCPEGLFTGAERELRNARNWSAPEAERKDSAVRYLNIRGRIGNPALLARLDALDGDLGRRARAGYRTPLSHAQGGG